LGHDVWGFSGVIHGDDDLTIAAFKELGIEAYHGNKLEGMIDKLNPDLVCGERYHPRWPVENLGQDWVNSHNRIGFLLQHTVICRYIQGNNPGPRTHLLVSNESQYESRTPPFDDRWPKDKVHVLGPPGFGFVTEKVDMADVRSRLGVKNGQPLVAIFFEMTPGRPGDCPTHDELRNLVNAAQRKGYKVALHAHPMDRRHANSDNISGFFNQSDVAQIAKWLHSKGVTICVDYAPGTIMDVPFERFPAWELMRSADCVMTSSHDVVWEAYALGKSVHTIHHGGLATFVLDDIIDREYETSTDSITKMVSAIERGSNDVEQDPVLIEKFIHKNDGLWWQRALNLAESLILVDK